MGWHHLVLFVPLAPKSGNSRLFVLNNSLPRETAGFSLGKSFCTARFFLLRRFESVNRPASISRHLHALSQPLSAVSKPHSHSRSREFSAKQTRSISIFFNGYFGTRSSSLSGTPDSLFLKTKTLMINKGCHRPRYLQFLYLIFVLAC